MSASTADKSTADRPRPADTKKVHITETKMTLKNWYKHVNWLNVTFILGVPIYGVIQSLWVPLQLKTAVWAVLYYFYTGLGITAGYHRLWAHSAYSATLPLKIFLAAAGGGAVEGSIRWWARDHRAHHRYTDTEKDPYSVRKGLLYSHLGWMVMKQNPKRIGRTDITDLNDDPIVVWQHRNFLKVVVVMGLLVPTCVAGLGWGDWFGGFIYAGILRVFFVQQATFCVNSLAHWLGDQPFDDRNSPRDHVITALVTLGEGYHNFHHEFPSDYRNAIEWHQYDPTKWFIWVCKQLGLAYDLKQFRSNEIEKGRLQQLQKKLDRRRAKLDWGVPLDQLPVMEWDDYVEQAKNGRGLIAIAGVVHDVTDFIKDHPGGKAMISSGLGKDATAMFNGGVYYHSNAAHNLLSTMRVGVIRGGCEVEIWKRSQKENSNVDYVRDANGQRIVRAGEQVTKIPEPIATAVWRVELRRADKSLARCSSRNVNIWSSLMHRQSRTATFPRLFLVSLVSSLLVLSIAIILAHSRLSLRLAALVQQLPIPLASIPPLRNVRSVTTSTMASAKFKQPPQAPPLFVATPTSIIEDTKRLIAQSRKIQDQVASSVTAQSATFESALLPLAHDENAMTLEAHILGFYQAVSTDAKLRDASSEAEKLLDDFGIETAMREDLYQLVDAALKKKETLHPESQRLLEKEHKDYIRNGLGLPAGPKRDRFKEIKKRLSQLSIEFQKNLNEENGGIWFTPAELDGVPEDVLSGLEKGSGENEGKLRLSFKYPDLWPTLKYATNAETRKRVSIGNENKCNQNVPLFKEAMVLRDEAARLLGYPNHAAFRIEDKMAKTTETVDSFLGDLRSRLAAGGLKEIEKLKELKKADLESRGETFDGHYFLWDHRFYDRLMLEKEYQLDHQKISEYFPLQTTIRGMLEIFEELFGLVFVEVTGDDRSKISETGKGEDIVWHEDVQLFSVWNDASEGEGFVGYLYLDLHPREGKYGHAANFNLQPGFVDANGNRRYPATALVCNFSKPTAKKPSLLKHEEVTTLFHELGHGIHDLVAKTVYSRFHGTNTVRDFVEAPSQMLENWCWTPSQLKSLSRHYSTLSDEYAQAYKESSTEAAPERIPDEYIDSLIRTKHVNDALFNLRQLHFGIFDMTMHEPASHEAIEALDPTTTYNSLRHEISKIEGPEALGQGYDWGHGQATFGHLMGGYDAGYYGYLSSQVYSTDMFYTVFKANPMDPVQGRRYRHTVLEKGGSQEEMRTLTEFLGREPKTEAFYKELGLA